MGQNLLLVPQHNVQNISVTQIESTFLISGYPDLLDTHKFQIQPDRKGCTRKK